jgi:hypothetical protein
MPRVMVTYTVREEHVAENERLVRDVYAGLAEIDDPGISYATFKLEDGKTFVHIALIESPKKQDILSGSPAFQAFQENLGARCEVPPNPEPLALVGSVNFSGT